MSTRLKTSQRILDASRTLFNNKGYAATTLAEIASAVGIAQGNLTYHFPTKRDLALRLEEEAQRSMQSRWDSPRSNAIADDYVEHLLFGMHLTWHNRFLLRDHAQFADDPNGLREHPYLKKDFEELQQLLRRIGQEKKFRRDLGVDLEVLARSLWITSRYWLDHLEELEGIERITWTDLECGVQHHFALLLPCLVAPARREFKTALQRAMHFVRGFDHEMAAADITILEKRVAC
jgi:AcrR family transcriptional regulator